MKKLILTALIAQTAIAGTKLPKTVCPNITEEANTLISSLQGIEGNLAAKEECRSIAESIKNVGSIISSEKWKKYKDIVTGSNSQALEGNEIAELQTLTTSASETISEAISRLGNNQNCLQKESKASTMSTISGVVKEVSTVVGSAAGPYGIAISMTGGLLSSAIDGIDKIYKKNKPYNFKKLDEEKIFMNQFCSFVEAKKDIKDFLGMASRKKELVYLDKYLDVKEKDLLENCPLCNSYKDALVTKVKVDKIIQQIKSSANVVDYSNNSDNMMTMSRCPQIAKEIYTRNSGLKRFYIALKEYKNSGMSESDRDLIKQIVSVEEILESVYPDARTCSAMSATEKTKISYQFNDFLRDDIFPTSESIFGSQLYVFQLMANKKYKNPLGDYIATTIERKAWIKKQLKDIDQKVARSLIPTNRDPILRLDLKLSQRMNEQLMPQYIKYLIKNNNKSLKKFRKQFTKFRNSNLEGHSNLASKLEALKSSQDARSYLSRQRQITTLLDYSLAQTEKIKLYCDYLKYVTSRTIKTDELCTKKVLVLNTHYQALATYQDDINAMNEFDIWADNNLNILSSRVMDYADRIRVWTDRGSERWQLYIEPTSQNLEQRIEQEDQNWLSGSMFEER